MNKNKVIVFDIGNVIFFTRWERAGRFLQERYGVSSKKIVDLFWGGGWGGRFTKEWKWNAERRCLENLQHGCTIQVIDAVDEATGEVAYEGIVIESQRIEMDVVVRQEDGYFGFVYHRRFSVIKPAYSIVKFAKNPTQIISVVEAAQKDSAGIEEYQIVHGLAKARFEEVLEEIGLQWIVAEPIGFVKESPPLGGPAHELFAVMVGRKTSGHQLELNEEISHVKFFPPEKVREVLEKTICGMTKAALWTFRSWGLKQSKYSFWHSAAVRL